MKEALKLAQEPVAWMSSDRAWMWSDYSKALAAVANIPTLTLIPLYTAPPKRERVVFPTMLRKMWSGGEVQAWLDENVNKEKNT
jgi:hypothetical protein